MKKYSVLFVAALLFFSCEKNDLNVENAKGEVTSVENADEEDITAFSQSHSKGQLQTRVLNNTLNYPWEIVWGPDNFIWFTEREGRVKRMNPRTGAVIPVATIAEVASTTNFNGLLGMVLHPHFHSNPFVYVVYNYYGAGGAYLEKIVRFTYNGSTLISPKTLVDGIVGKIGGDFIHNGSRLVIGSDRKLYATTGDANLRFDLPQNTSSLNGKVLRVNLDGSIPADNPYGNAVWSIGHRNSQGMAFGMGRLYISEHGETTNDEINIISRGRNYGWPYVEGYCDLPAEQTFCNANYVREPIYAWTPTVAPSGMEFYDCNKIPEWRRSLLVTFLKDRKLRQMRLNKTGTAIQSVQEYFVGEFGRLRDVAISPDGKVYLSTDNGNNRDMIIEVTKGYQNQ